MNNPANSSQVQQNLAKQGVFVGGKMSGADLKAHEQKLFQDLRDAHLSGKRKLTAYRQRQYLTSFASRLIATETAYKSVKAGLRPPKSALPAIAEELNAWCGVDEKVGVIWKAKKSNPYDFRTIMNFGLKNRALQYLVARCLKAQINLHPKQFAINGGRNAAVQYAIEAMYSGYQYVTEMDVRNCYPSFNGKKLSGLLPIPKEVTERIVLSQYLNLYPADKMFQSWSTPLELIDVFSGELAEARRGIAQGSATSNVVAEILLSSVLAQLPDYGVALSYADNILLLAKSNQEAVAMSTALSSALQAHPAGPLKLKDPKIYEPGQAVEFLGYSMSVTKAGCAVEPSAENSHKFKAKFDAGLENISASASSAKQEKLVKALKRYVNSWSSAFTLWSGAKQHREKYLAMLG